MKEVMEAADKKFWNFWLRTSVNLKYITLDTSVLVHLLLIKENRSESKTLTKGELICKKDKIWKTFFRYNLHKYNQMMTTTKFHSILCWEDEILSARSRTSPESRILTIWVTRKKRLWKRSSGRYRHQHVVLYQWGCSKAVHVHSKSEKASD